MADDVITPRIFLALHVNIPPSCDVTSVIIRPPRDCAIRLCATRLEFSFNHVTCGLGFPLTSHWNEAVPVWFTTTDIGGDTIAGAEIDSPGLPLSPWGPWSPLGPGGPWSPSAPLSPLGPCGPWGPGGPCLPGGPLPPGLPRLSLILFGQCTVQARLLSAIWTSSLISPRLMVLLEFDSLFLFPKLRLWRMCISARNTAVMFFARQSLFS